MKVGSVVRKAMRAGRAGTLDRALQIARVRIERRTARREGAAPSLWAHLRAEPAKLREARRAALQGDAERAEQQVFDVMRQRASFLPALADTDVTLSAARDRFPEACAATIAAADRALAHRFTLFGWMEVDAGSEISWLHDPFTGNTCPPSFWADLDLDHSATLNVRMLWELNRHQHLVELARAYGLTRDQRYADEVARQMRSWIAQNPYGLGPNWAASLEVALRAIAWLWVQSLLLRMGGMTSRLNLEIASVMLQSGTHIARHLSHTYAPNTHLLGEALGLVYMGAALPELAEARRWFALGRRLLIREAELQFLSDGFHFEHSTWYHRFATDMCLHAAVVCRQAGQPLPRPTLERIQRMVDCLAALGANTGPVISMGDEDGGMLLPLAHIPPRNFRDTMSVGAALFGRADLKPSTEEPAEAVLWLLGPQALSNDDALVPDALSSGKSVVLPGVGLVIMRSESGLSLAFDCGGRCPPESAHDHADALSIQLHSAAGPLLADPGTYVYAGLGGWRQYFRSTAAHNTVVIDGRGQAQADGPFAWRASGDMRRRECFCNMGFDYAEGEYLHHPRVGRIAHTRRLLYVKPDYWVVCDLVSGDETHDLEQWFHLPPCQATLDASGRCVAQTPGGRLVLAPVGPGAQAHMVEGEEDPIQGWVSDAFGRKSPAPAVCYHTRALLPAALVTVVAAREYGSLPVVVPLGDEHGSSAAAIAVQWLGCRDHMLLAPGDGRARAFGAYETDARAACVREDSSGEVTAISLCSGTFLRHRGKNVVVLGSRANDFHATREGRSVELWGTIDTVELGWAAGSAQLNGQPATLDASAIGITVKGTPAPT